MRSCKCGKEIKPEAATNTRFWDMNYCSKYCREFDERGLEKVNRGEKLRGEGNKNWKNFTGFFDYPTISSECICCGSEVKLHKTQDHSKPYCSRSCLNKIHRMPKSRKSVFVFTMLRIMKHRYLNNEGEERWISGNMMFNLMQNMGGHPYKNGYPMIMNIWAARGLLIKREQGYTTDRGASAKHNVFCFNPTYLEVPLGKAFYECAGAKWE